MVNFLGISQPAVATEECLAGTALLQKNCQTLSISSDILSLEKLPSIFQTFLDQTYSQKTVPAQSVMIKMQNGSTVPFLGLAVDQRQEAMRPYLRSNHFQLIEKLAREGKSYDYTKALLGKSEEDLRTEPEERVFLPCDPRRFHGIDHAIRTALFSVIFCHLYHQHLDAIVPEHSFAYLLFAGIAHDGGRQRDGGIDIDEERSVELIVEYLQHMQMSQDTISLISEILVNKDSKLPEKSVLSKCLHDADSIEFGRFELVSSKDHWKVDRERLNLVQDCKSRGVTISEIDHIFDEVSLFIKNTCGKDSRARFSASDTSYYEEILHTVSDGEYPHLYDILRKSGVVR